IVERITGMSLNEYVYKTFYKPLGMATTGYLPRTKFPLNRIPTTEYDLMYRKQLVHGDVHDPGAAMMGGVAGHAGLFSSANDLAKIMQLYLNWGTFAGKQYLTENTLKEYAKCQYCETNR